MIRAASSALPAILGIFMLPLKVSSFSTIRPVTSVTSRLFATASVDITEIMRREATEETTKLVDHYLNSPHAPMIWTCRDDASAYVDANIDAILFDLDGVIYRGLDPTPDASSCLKKLIEKGKTCLFVTNNAGASRQHLRDKLNKVLGITELNEDQMIGSAYSCASFLKKNIPTKGRVYVIGAAGLCEEIENHGFTVTGGLSNDKASMSRDELAEYAFPEEPVDAVVVGLDNEFNYRKLCISNVLLQRNPKALLVCTNQDAFDLIGADARHLPGNGCLVKCIEHGSGRTAINVGKPTSILADLIVAEHWLDPSRTLFVGDRLDTDIKFGKSTGMKTALVMTGVTSTAILQAIGKGTDEEPLPTMILPFMGLLA